MTPLANRFLKSIPRKEQRPYAEALSETHFFDITAILDTAEAFASSVQTMEEADRIVAFNARTFLPAPKTWLEWQTNQSTRWGLMIMDNGTSWAEVYLVYEHERHGPISLFRLGLVSIGGDDYYFIGSGVFPTEICNEVILKSILASAHMFLAMINTPKIFGRRQHMPLASHQRRMADALGVQGKFPLRAWTELKLEVCVPKDMRAEGIHEARLTGRKALHFCRAHLRFRNGAFEFVRSHWRGDASLGMKRTRYTVVPPRSLS